MFNDINVREILGVEERRPALFIKETGPDKIEAAKRLAITEKNFEDWHRAINSTNTRQLPADLVDLYEEAALILCRILTFERNIATGGGRS